MTKKAIDIRLAITVVTLIFTIGGSYAITQSKLSSVDSNTDKVVGLDKRVIVIEVESTNTKEMLKEQKQLMHEQRNDIKSLLKYLMER